MLGPMGGGRGGNKVTGRYEYIVADTSEGSASQTLLLSWILSRCCMCFDTYYEL